MQISRSLSGDEAIGELDNEASVVGLLLGSGQEGRTSSMLEDFPDALASSC